MFSGRASDDRGGEHDAAYQRIICSASTAFWDATLRQDHAAQQWLEEGGFTGLLGQAGRFEQKRPTEPGSSR